MEPQKLSIQRLMRSRSILYQRILEKQESVDNSREVSGEYVGYDCREGRDLIRTISGGIISAVAISTGVARPNELTWLSLPSGTVQPLTDRMPSI